MQSHGCCHVQRTAQEYLSVGNQDLFPSRSRCSARGGDARPDGRCIVSYPIAYGPIVGDIKGSLKAGRVDFIQHRKGQEEGDGTLMHGT